MQALSIEYSKLNYASALISSSKKVSADAKNPDVFAGTQQDNKGALALQIPGKGLGLYNGNGLRISAERLEYTSLSISYMSKDGDSAVLNRAGSGTEASGVAANEKPEADDLRKLMEYVKDTLVSLKEEIMKGFVESHGGEYKETEIDETEVAELEAAMPEYWNAENTSQRIVDFATSFFPLSKMSPEDYMTMMKEAIDLGFGQAKDESGELPSAVEGLMSKTHRLVMEKLQAWADSMATPEQTAEAQVVG